MIKRLENYGFIKGKINNFESQLVKINPLNQNKEFIPHYTFALNCESDIYHANINVFSINQLAPNLKVYFTNNPEIELKNISKLLFAKKLNNGVYKKIPIEYSIDYLRDNIFDLNKLQKITDDKNIEKNILLELIDSKLQVSKLENYDICIWGQLYDNLLDSGLHKFGIHDIHMNQGNFNGMENGVYSDGCMIIIDPIKNKIVFAVFISFDGQCTKTFDENGDCLIGLNK